MRILVSGSTGLVGRALVKALEEQGHTIGRLVRRSANHSNKEVYWDPGRGSIDKSALSDFAPEAVINLAGENIASGRWSETKKQKIRDSRVHGARILSQALASLEHKPKVLLAASAVGFYGDSGDQLLDENSSAGETFLAQVCQEWEQATQVAQDAGIRVVILRIGMVLTKRGGALKKMLLPFRFGVGGILGNGRQYISWITLEDLVAVFLFALEQDSLKGPANAVAPVPVTNREFTKTLGRALLRPTIFPIPASTARMLFGEMADEVLLSSARAQPNVLQQAGYIFQYPELKAAIKHVLKAH